jgi:regulator of protease activity HflC (stomatin/prohibitin superfamily)
MKKLLIVLATMVVLVGCGEKVEVPTAHVGKILGKNGFAPDTLTPSKFRLEPCMTYCDKLVVAQVSDTGAKENMQLFMPKDKLNLTFDVRFTYSISRDGKTIDQLFDRLPAVEAPEGSPFHNWITSNLVYNTYGAQAVRGIVRSEMVKYSIMEVMENRESIGKNIHATIASKLKETKTPITISRFELANVQPPEIIVKAQEEAKKREIDIQTTEAQASIDILQAERDLEIAQKNRLVKKENALAIAEQNKIAAKSVTPQLLEYRRLEVQEKVMSLMAKNNASMIVPFNMDTTSQMAMFSKILGKEVKGNFAHK